MEFFKSVFPGNQNPQTTPPSLFQTIANTYLKDLQEFTSTLKEETSFITEVAALGLDSGTAIAQLSLEAVGDVIDNVGSTLSHVIIGKDSSFVNKSDKDSNCIDKISKDSNFSDVRGYSRVDGMIRGLQCDVKTYCEEIEESGYDEWRIGFRVDEKSEEIGVLLGENGVVGEIFSEVVPGVVDETTFWCRYFYRVGEVLKREELRLRVVRRASVEVEEEEELSWDFDDDDDDSEGEAGVSGEKGVDGGLKVEEKAGSEGRIESDFSVISSQRSSRVGEDFGWDEIEDIGSGYESKVVDHGIRHTDGGLRKQLSDEEELTWDVEDDDQNIEK